MHFLNSTLSQKYTAGPFQRNGVHRTGMFNLPNVLLYKHFKTLYWCLSTFVLQITASYQPFPIIFYCLAAKFSLFIGRDVISFFKNWGFAAIQLQKSKVLLWATIHCSAWPLSISKISEFCRNVFIACHELNLYMILAPWQSLRRQNDDIKNLAMLVIISFFNLQGLAQTC